MPDLFTTPDQETQIDPNKDYYAELVGEGKKFKDNTALAKAKVESDAFIERLQKENAQAREALKNSLSMQAFLDKLGQQTRTVPAEPNSQVTPPVEPNAVNKGLSLEEVQSFLEQREKISKEETNLNKAVEAAKKAYGANYGQVLAQKAQQLGVSQEFLTSVAKSSVPAFLEIVGVKEAVPENTQVFPQSSVSSQRPTNTSTEKTKKYYDDIRQKDMQLYLSPRIQNEMHDQALKLGEAFFA